MMSLQTFRFYRIYKDAIIYRCEKLKTFVGNLGLKYAKKLNLKSN